MRMLTPYWTTRGLASDLFDEMDRMFSGFNRFEAPGSEITEEEDHFLMSLDLPGMKKEEIKIDLHENILTIAGERKRETTKDQRSYGSFRRSFTLPTSIESEKVEAHYENGVLELYLPKAATSKARHIEIQTGKTGGIFDKLLGSRNKDLKDVSDKKPA